MNDGRPDDDRLPDDLIPGRDDDARHDAGPDTGLPGRPYPGVQGGVPLHQDHDGDAEEEAGPRTLRVDPDLPTPELRAGTLNDVEGQGLLMISRDAGGGIVEADGTWRPDDLEMSLEALHDAFADGSTTTFAGTRIEGRDETTAEHVRIEVVIRRVSEYTYDDGTRHAVVSFGPSDMG